MKHFYYKNKKFHFESGHYASNDRLYLHMIESDTLKPYSCITVNFKLLDHEPYNFLAFDINNFPDCEYFFHDLNLLLEYHYHITSGFCSYPVFSVDFDLLQDYTFGSVYSDKFYSKFNSIVPSGEINNNELDKFLSKFDDFLK